MEAYIGQIELFPYDGAPKGWVLCDGRELQLIYYTALYSLIFNKFGGEITTFNIPDLRGKEPIEGIAYYMALDGSYPSRDCYGQSDVFVGQVTLFPYGSSDYEWAPGSYIHCRNPFNYVYGSGVSASYYPDLFEVLGSKFWYPNIFKVPELKGKEPITGTNYCIAYTGMYPSWT